MRPYNIGTSIVDIANVLPIYLNFLIRYLMILWTQIR